jgi:biotin carboxyl carrier protein
VKYKIVTDAGEVIEGEAQFKGSKIVFLSGEERVELEVLGRGSKEGEFLVKVGEEIHSVEVDGDFLVFDGEPFRVESVVELSEEIGEGGMGAEIGKVTSPLQGRVSQIHVKESERVTRGQPLLSLEAMKSETVISSPVNGVVKRILVRRGQGVKRGETLVTIEPE